MKQVFLNLKAKKIELMDIPAPALRPGGVLVKNYFSLISSGTERQIISLGEKNLFEKARARPDQVRQAINKIKADGVLSALNAVKTKLDDALPLGYSSVGEVSQVAPEVKEFKVGDLVACAGQNYASHAEVIFVPKNLCVKINADTDLKAASFITLGAIAMQGIRRANLTQGESVAVLGLGLIGQLTVQILKAYGFSVVGIDNKEKMENFAKDFGLDLNLTIGKDDIQESILKFTDGQGVDAVIITASTKTNQPIELAGQILRSKGRVSAVGDVDLSIPRKIYYEKELDFFISRSYGPGRYDNEYEEKGRDYPIEYVRWTEKRNMEEFLRLCQDKKIHPEKLITNVFGIEKFKEAYDYILNPKKEALAILFEYQHNKEIERTILFESNKKFEKKDKVINVGLIGAGSFAKSTILPILSRIQEVNLKAVASAEGKDARNIAKKFGSSFITTDYKTILDDKDIDLVIVATRHNLHSKIAAEALNKNKDVHIEKPLALNMAQLKEVIYAAKNSKGRMVVGFNRRFSPAVAESKNFFGKNSGPFFITIRINAGFLAKNHWTKDPEEGGGRIIGEVCHFVDLVQCLAESPISRVFATNLSKASDEDVLISLSLGDGSQASIIYTTQAPNSLPKECIEIIGGGKTARIENFKSWSFYSAKGKKTKKLFLSQDKGHKNEFAATIDAIKNAKAFPIPLKEIINSTFATFKILESLKDGTPKEVNTDEI